MVYTERKCKHHASGGFEPSTSLLSGNSAKRHISVQLQQQYQYDNFFRNNLSGHADMADDI